MKRKVFGCVLLGLGVFLLVAGVIATTWAPGVVKKTPLDVNSTTHLDGTVGKIDLDTGELVENPVKVQSITRTDSEASTDDVAVFVSATCVVIDVDDPADCVDGDDPRLVNATEDVFASDRVTGESIPDFEGLPEDAVPHEGLVKKWPFDAEKKSYMFWDGTLGHAVEAVYDRTDTLDGVEVYVYKTTITDAEIEIAEGTPGTYDNTIENWVEPRTGSIQQQTQDQQRYLEDGTQVLDLKVGFTDEQIQTFADDARANLRTLDLLLFWVPLVGFVGGGLCVIAGVALLLSGRRRGASSSREQELAGTSA